LAKILIAEDEEGIRSFMTEALRLDGHDVTAVGDGAEAQQALLAQPFALLITDVKLPGADGIAVLRAAMKAQPAIQAIVVTAFGTVESAVEAMKLGAFDYLQKPLRNLAQLRTLVTRALAARPQSVGPGTGGPRLTWGAVSMEPVVRAVERVASNATVLLLGESGVGKEVAARAIHETSARRGGPFEAINCASLTADLVGSELFGHEKGAFTGAHERKKGRLEMAEGGTFFLDEVGELQPELQSRLLRVLEERRFSRVGGTQTVEANVRWISATNRDLQAMVAAGTFREDLYHRLAVFPIALPPLRSRKEDILPLSALLLEKVAQAHGRPPFTLDASAAALLKDARWDGNVRELRNTLERAAILAEGTELRREHFSLAEPVRAAAPTGDAGTLEDMEKKAIMDALEAVHGHRQRAANRLGIGLRTLYEKLKRYGLS